jgi:uncharacterized membrane protein YdjX (TVP38/TMEM64 family)
MLYEYFETFRVFLEQQDKFTAGWLLILSKAISGVTFLPGTPLTVLSGVVLGTFWGSMIAWVGNLLGAILAFLLARYLLKDYVQNVILKKYPKINEYEDKLFRDGLYTVLFLRFVPIFPFNVLNFTLGVTEVKFRDYFIGTAVGMIPGTILFVYLGESFRMLSVWNMLLAVVGIAGLVYIGKFIKRKN